MAHLHNIIFLLKDAGFWKEAYSLTLLHPELAFNKEIGKALVSKLPKSGSHALYEKIILSPVNRLKFWGGCGFMLSEAALGMAARALMFENTEYIVSRGHNPTSSLMRAVEAGHVAMIKLFLEHGADPNTDNGKPAMTPSDVDDHKENYDSDDYKKPALWCAVKNENVEIINLLLEHGADVNGCGFFDETPLHVSYDNMEIVKILVAHGADVNAQDSDNKTPLHVSYDNLEIVKILVAHGADVNAQDSDIKTPLFCAVEKQCENVREVTTVLGEKFMEKTADYSVEIIEYLVEHGADVNSHNHLGETPIIKAMHIGSFELVKYFIEHGADVNARDDGGDSAFTLMLSFPMFFPDKFLYFLENGADVHSVNDEKETPLLQLCRGNPNLKTVQKLIEHGADVNAADEDGNTPLINATKYHCNLKLINYLLEKGADVNAANEDGNTPHDYAVMSCRIELVRCLIEHGAIEKKSQKKNFLEGVNCISL